MKLLSRAPTYLSVGGLPVNVPRDPVLAVLMLALGSLAGCGGGGPKTIPVSGVVTFQGRDQPEVCRLFFRPETSQGPSRPSVTEVEDDGTYEARAFKDSDGLIPGTYRISVSYFDPKPGGNPSSHANYIERTFDAGEVVVAPEADEVEHNVDVPLNAGKQSPTVARPT